MKREGVSDLHAFRVHLRTRAASEKSKREREREARTTRIVALSLRTSSGRGGPTGCCVITGSSIEEGRAGGDIEKDEKAEVTAVVVVSACVEDAACMCEPGKYLSAEVTTRHRARASARPRPKPIS